MKRLGLSTLPDPTETSCLYLTRSACIQIRAPLNGLPHEENLTTTQTERRGILPTNRYLIMQVPKLRARHLGESVASLWPQGWKGADILPTPLPPSWEIRTVANMQGGGVPTSCRLHPLAIPPEERPDH